MERPDDDATGRQDVDPDESSPAEGSPEDSTSDESTPEESDPRHSEPEGNGPEEPAAEEASPRREPERLPLYYRVLRNWFGVVGVAIFGTAIALFAFFFLIELFSGEQNPYLGLFHFLVLPPLGLLGLALMGIGLWFNRRRRRLEQRASDSLATFDLRRTEVQQRVIVMTGMLGAALIFAMGVGGYRAYEFTDSVSFCGEVCHAVMEPEFVAYQNSAHARVGCVECHVGPGAGWYVRSKLAGLYQVYAVLTDNFPRPIPTPIHSLRPAQQTCEQCHWPRYFFGDRRKTFTHYLTDGGEEPWVIDMLITIGGGDPERGYTHGIHWHMNIGNTVEYIARDDQRQDIPWIRIVDDRGNTTVYTDADNPLSQELIDSSELRLMDCMDCHNRPSHVYQTPVHAVNRELQIGNLDPAMPDIKFMAVELLAAEYAVTAAADQGSTDGLRESYASFFPDYYATNRRAVDEAVVVLKRVYGENFFPDMKVRWDVYPDDIGHMSSPGCFRCHDGNHRSSDGRIIPTDCNSCHTILAQGYADDRLQTTPAGLPFLHPGDGEVMDEPILCFECHDGALGLSGQ